MRFASAGFALAMAGGYLFLNSPATAVTFKDLPPSVADAACKQKWVDEARNDPALSCYLTNQQSRLCNPDERKHLAMFISAYEGQRRIFEAKLVQYLLTVQRNASQGKSFNESARLAAKDVATDNMKKAMRLKLLVDNEVRDLIVPLIKRGLISSDNFSWGYPHYVEAAFNRVPENERRPSC
jgi:hypothetical protein